MVLLGASGSGKSTLLNILGGLAVRSSGRVEYRGFDLTHADELGTTTAIITHNAPIAAMAERVITLADGRIAHVEVAEVRKAAEELRW